MNPTGRGILTAAEPVVLIVAKSPRPGKVKTRLCPPATPEQAAEIAAAALLDTLQAARECGGTTVVALAGELTGATRETELAGALDQCTVIPQRGSCFAERLVNAHADTATRCPGRAVVQVGMDTPQLDAALLRQSMDALLADGVQATLGPAADGGWWALGLRDPRWAWPLGEVAMSSADTGARTAAVFRMSGLNVVRLPMLSDVDTVADICRVRAQAPRSRFAAATALLAAKAAGAGAFDRGVRADAVLATRGATAPRQDD